MSEEMKRKIEDAARTARLASSALQEAEKKEAEAAEGKRKAEVAHEDAQRTRILAASRHHGALVRFRAVTGELLHSWY